MYIRNLRDSRPPTYACATVEQEITRKGSPAEREALYLQAVNLRHLNRCEEALVVLDLLQQAHPRYSRLHEELGHCHAALYDIPKAIDAFRQAVSINAALPASWQMLHILYQKAGDDQNAAQAAHNLATISNLPTEIVQAGSLFADGELVPAERILRIYLSQQGGNIEAMRMLGRICIANDRPDDAEPLLEAVVLQAPGYRAARADYASALLNQHKYLQSRGEFQLLLDLDPHNRAYLRQYAMACIGLGDFEPGIELYRRLLDDAQPGLETAELHRWIGYALRILGRQAEAIREYQAAIAAWPDSGEAWYGLSNFKTYRFSGEEIARMRALESSSAASAEGRCHLYFALGKALEDEARYEDSWRFYERGNALKCADTDEVLRGFEINARQSKQVCTREFFEARQGWGATDPDPIFIVGLTRSGSTLIEQILASHPQVEGTHELPEIQRIVRDLHGRVPDPVNPRYPGNLLRLGPQELRHFGERFLDDTRVYRQSGRPFFIDKMPGNFCYLGLIQLMLPQAKIIDARREPMACCFGNLKQLFSSGQEFSYSIDGVARYYRMYLDLMRHWHTALPGRILTVLHEDLVQDLEGSTRRILDFCGLPFEPACLAFHKTTRNVYTVSSEQVRRPISREGVDQWRHYEPWLRPLQHTLGDALTSYRQ